MSYFTILSLRPRSSQRRRRDSTSGVTSPDPQLPEFPPIGNGNRSKSTTDVTDQNRFIPFLSKKTGYRPFSGPNLVTRFFCVTPSSVSYLQAIKQCTNKVGTPPNYWVAHQDYRT